MVRSNAQYNYAMPRGVSTKQRPQSRPRRDQEEWVGKTLIFLVPGPVAGIVLNTCLKRVEHTGDEQPLANSTPPGEYLFYTYVVRNFVRN